VEGGKICFQVEDALKDPEEGTAGRNVRREQFALRSTRRRRERRRGRGQSLRTRRHDDLHGAFTFQENKPEPMSLRIPLERRQVVPPVAAHDEVEVER
jgi:hypothetical protein